MQIFYCDEFVLPLPEGHRFPMAKYARLRERISADPMLRACQLQIPPAATDQQLLAVHSPDYVQRVSRGELSTSEQRRIGFPWSEAMVTRSRRSVGGTIAALATALDEGVAVNLAGGTHHAARDHGAGYCVFNDAVVAARAVQRDGLARRVLLVDLDVHQGDGSASLCADDPSIFTFSMHAARNYPARKPPSDLDVALPDGTGDGDYLAALDLHLPQALERSGADAIVYLAGADPYRGDRLGYLALSKAGLAQRDQQVFAAAAQWRLPVALVMAGGYAEQVDDIVDIHLHSVRQACAHWLARHGGRA